ncbi:hypothetical protein B0T25DRAFT_465644 [Lasiosphaeria hispida]|uniref:Uncharacterized protein n=1 Tax=Lasiosphaeria hispida TaxID=260671 RepID=A0AAJ0M950_9PEZI|nr:hypothetical protein B0T25DRAFT_465644 [Lasiosphaeria hispida]
MAGNFDKPRLTRKNLALLNSLNGDSKSTKNSDYFESDTMKSTPTTDPDFEQKAYDNGIMDPTASKQPHDADIVKHHLTLRRQSTQPSERAHEEYCYRISRSHNETETSRLVQSKLMIDYEDRNRHYGRSNGRAITQIPQQDFNRGLSNPLPDVLEGLVTDTLPTSLHGQSLHSNTRSSSSLALCHFATEFKRTDANLRQAVYQAAYDGATLVNARNRTLAEAKVHAASVQGLGVVVDKAAKETAVLTSVNDGKVVGVYAHHFQDGEYHQNLVARESLLLYPNRGRELIRNAQDFARRKSYELEALFVADMEEE